MSNNPTPHDDLQRKLEVFLGTAPVIVGQGSTMAFSGRGVDYGSTFVYVEFKKEALPPFPKDRKAADYQELAAEWRVNRTQKLYELANHLIRHRFKASVGPSKTWVIVKP